MCAAALVGLFAACSSEIETPQVTDDDWQSPDGRVVVQLGSSSLTGGAALTRAPYGDKVSEVTDFGIFALAYQNYADEPIVTDGKPQPADWSLDSGTSYGNRWYENDNFECLLLNVRGRGDTTPEKEGKITLYGPSDATGTGDAGIVYYYPMQYQYFYAFYGYAPYQSSAKVANETATVDIPMDGNTDIIWGRSYNEEGTVAADLPEATGLQGHSDGRKVFGYNARYIRKVKYHNEQDPADQKQYRPNLVFNHLLTRFNFVVVPASDQASDDVTAVQNQITVTDIRITNQSTPAILDVANGTITPKSDAKTDFIMWMEEDNEISSTNKISLTGRTNQYATPDGYIMTWPVESKDTELEVKVTMEIAVAEDGVAAFPTKQTVSLKLRPSDFKTTDGQQSLTSFAAGKAYLVKIGVYAVQEVEIEATITGWQEEGGSVELPVE